MLVIVSAFEDLYHPGSSTAKKYADIATGIMVITVILSLPLWYKKLRAIEDWVQQMDKMDVNIRKQSIWLAVKPMAMTILYAIILTVIISGIIYYYNLLPTEIIMRYKAYYAPINYSNITGIYPNTSLDYP